MTTTIALRPLANSEQKAEMDISTVPAATASGERARLRTPLFVPSNQTYYWTKEWQDGEAEALKDIASGRVHRFSSGAAAAEWLLREEE